MKHTMLKKSTRGVLQAFLFGCPFLLLFGLPLLDMRSEKKLILPLESSQQEVLLYFGYPGCGVSCPDTLQKLSRAFEEFKIDSIEVKFINILKSVKAQQAEDYAQAYHSSFSSPELTPAQKKQLFEEFNISEESVYKADLDHSNFLFLLTKTNQEHWRMTRAFPDVEGCTTYLERRKQSD